MVSFCGLRVADGMGPEARQVRRHLVEVPLRVDETSTAGPEAQEAARKSNKTQANVRRQIERGEFAIISQFNRDGTYTHEVVDSDSSRPFPRYRESGRWTLDVDTRTLSRTNDKAELATAESSQVIAATQDELVLEIRYRDEALSGLVETIRLRRFREVGVPQAKSPPADGPLTASEIATTLYADPDCRHLAFSCANHSTLVPFRQLDSFLKTDARHDKNFRYVLVELPADLKSEFLGVSTGEPTYEEWLAGLDQPWQQMMTARPQVAFCSTLFETIREINVDRPEHPILLVPVDGFTTKRVMVEVGRMQASQTPPSHSFVDSINRERDTAKNVLAIIDQFPEARGAMIYHQGHLLRGLRRELPELDDESHSLIKREVTHSTWAGFAEQSRPGYGKS